MANPTTNYGFVMPTSTDLVTDLPADFDVFGQAVDNTLKALNPETTLGDIAYGSAVSNTNTRLGIGTNGQVLSVSGGVPAWTTTADVTPLTTKGDVFTFSTVDARIGVGADGTLLTADSSEATGLKWAVDPVADVVTTAGDLIYGTAADTVTRLGIGTVGQVLTVNSGATAPEWATAAAGGGKVLQVVQGTLTTDFTTTSGSYVDTGLSVSITPSSATSKIMAYSAGLGIAEGTGSLTSMLADFILVRTSTQLQRLGIGYNNFASASNSDQFGNVNFSYLDSPSTTSATTYKIQAKASASTNARLAGGATQIASIVVMEIGA